MADPQLLTISHGVSLTPGVIGVMANAALVARKLQQPGALATEDLVVEVLFTVVDVVAEKKTRFKIPNKIEMKLFDFPAKAPKARERRALDKLRTDLQKKERQTIADSAEKSRQAEKHTLDRITSGRDVPADLQSPVPKRRKTTRTDPLEQLEGIEQAQKRSRLRDRRSRRDD